MSGTAGRLNVELTSSGMAQVVADFARLESRVGALGTAQRKYEQDVALVQRAMAQNPALIERGTQALDALNTRFQQGSNSVSGFGGALRGLSGELSTVASGLGPVGTSLTAFGPGGLAAAAGLAVLTGGLVQVARAGDEMSASLGRIRAATGSLEAARDVYGQLFQLSLQTGQSVADSAGQFARFAIASKEIGATNAQAVRLVETMQKAAIVGGASTQEAAAAAMQLGQALASGVLQGEELRSILENMPNLASALARELGVGIGQLRQMGSEGKLTADVVMPALLRAGQDINRQYEQMPITMSRAFDQLTVASAGFASKLDEALGLSQAIARSLGAAANLLNSVSRAAFQTREQAAAARTTALQTRIAELEGSATSSSQAYRAAAGLTGAQTFGGTAQTQYLAGQGQARELEAARKELADHLAEQRSLERESREDREADRADADARGLANQRQRNTRETAELRGKIDKDVAIRREWQTRVDEINRLVAAGSQAGGLTQAEGQRLITLATNERDEALKKLDGTARREAEARTAESKARREALRAEAEAARDAGKVYATLRRDGNTGLLYGTESDDDMAREIQRALKGTQFDPAVRKRAQDQIERGLKASQERQQRLIERSTDSVVEYASDSFADLFDKNGTGWAGMLETFETTARRTFARIAAEAIIRPIITPIVGSVVGGMGGSGGTAVISGQSASGAAGILSNMSMSDYASIGMKLSGGSPMGNTGFSWLDNALASTVWESGSQAALTNSALSNVGTGPASNLIAHGTNAPYTNTALYGPATPGAVGYNSISTGQALSGGLSIAGGLYGIYQGAQIGGAKGWATSGAGAAGVIGGAAGLAGAAGIGGAAMASIAAVAPYAAAVLAIASLFLEGQKPSDMTGVYLGNLASGESSVTGLGGKRFSQENRDQATQIGQQIATLGDSLKAALGVDTLPFNYSVSVGARDGLVAGYGGTTRRYEADEAGSKQMIADITTAMINSMKGLASAEIQSIIGASGGNTETLLGNLDWYNGTYRAMIAKSETPPTQWQQNQDALLSPIDAAMAKARELGLSEEKLIEVRNRALQTLADQRTATLDSLAANDRQRQATASGVSSLMLQIKNFSKVAMDEVKALNEQLIQLGLTQEQRDPWLAERWRTLDAEQGALGRQREQQLTSNRNSLWDRYQAATGNNASADGQRWDYERKALAEWMTAAADGMTDLTMLARVQTEERLALDRRVHEERLSAELDGLRALQSQAGILTAFLDQQAVAGANVSPQQAFLAAQRQYDEALTAARAGGDLSGLTSAANTLLNANSDFNATGPAAEFVRDSVLSSVRNLGASLNLPGFSDNLTAGLERVMTPNTDAVTTLTREVAELREELRSQRLRAA